MIFYRTLMYKHNKQFKKWTVCCRKILHNIHVIILTSLSCLKRVLTLWRMCHAVFWVTSMSVASCIEEMPFLWVLIRYIAMNHFLRDIFVFSKMVPAFCLIVKIVCESIYGVEPAEIYHNNSVLNIYYYILKTLPFLSIKSMDFYVMTKML